MAVGTFHVIPHCFLNPIEAPDVERNEDAYVVSHNLEWLLPHPDERTRIGHWSHRTSAARVYGSDASTG